MSGCTLCMEEKDLFWISNINYSQQKHQTLFNLNRLIGWWVFFTWFGRLNGEKKDENHSDNIESMMGVGSTCRWSHHTDESMKRVCWIQVMYYSEESSIWERMRKQWKGLVCVVCVMKYCDGRKEDRALNVLDKVEGCFPWKRHCSDSMDCSPIKIKFTQWKCVALVFVGIWWTDFGLILNIDIDWLRWMECEPPLLPALG